MNKERLREQSEDPSIYKKRPDPHYSEKGGHKERSISNQPRHKNHWKKEEKKTS